MGTGLGHYIPLVAYIGFVVMTIVSLTKKPLYGLYYLMPFVPYRTMRDHFLDYPLGGNMLTILVIAVIVGALIKGKQLPSSKLYVIWFLLAVYLYLSMWIGTMMGNEPPPIWLSDMNFVTWKDYMLIPLLFVAAGLVVNDRKAVRTVIIITAISVFLVDRSSLLESLSRNMTSFDEKKRNAGPLAYGSNQLAAFLVQFAMFLWGVARIIKRKKLKLIFYGLVGLGIITDMYTFSRGSYLALLAAVFVLGVINDRKLLPVLAVFLFTWQVIVPPSVSQRVAMTQDSSGALESSAQERVDLWTQSENMFLSSPIIGTGYASFMFGNHVDGLKDTHNWFVKVLVETGIVGGVVVAFLLFHMVSAGYRLFRRAKDPLYQALGLGFLLAVIASLVANCFGDRWTYVEINGLLWVLAGTVVRALALTGEPEPRSLKAEAFPSLALEPQLTVSK